MKGDKITWIFFIIILAGIIGGLFHILRLHLLTEKTGSISVISNPAGAIVYLNGQEKGKTPLTINKIPQIEYSVKLVKEGFKIWEGKVKIKKKTKINKTLESLPTKIKYVVQKPVTTQASKPVKFGKLSVSSSPPGAKVYLDGISQREITPMNISMVKTGLHSIKLVKNNYQSFESKLEIKEGLTTYIKANLELACGSLFVNSNPAGATVYLNGEGKGVTPLTISKLIPWQPYQLQLTLFKYYDWNANIFVDPGKNEKIEVNLRPKLEGFIYVTSVPPLSSIYLDNELIGNTPLRKFEVEPGDYTLKIMQEGYLSETKRITVLPEKNVFVNFELKKGEEE
ncbi:MAG: PEGA domain-containing protein [bacterium]